VQLVAEIAGTYFLIFAGCSSVAVNLNFDKVVTLPGISITWGLAVMVLVYSVGHISGAHFNPAVTLAFATCKRFPWKQVKPLYLPVEIRYTAHNKPRGVRNLDVNNGFLSLFSLKKKKLFW